MKNTRFGIKYMENLSEQQLDYLYKRLGVDLERWLRMKFPLMFIEDSESILKRIHNELEEMKKIKKYIEEFSPEKIIEEAKKEISEFLKKEYPDIGRSTKILLKKIENKIEPFEKHIEKLKLYNSLSEDVYKLRDEFKEHKKFIDEFSKKLRSLFK